MKCDRPSPLPEVGLDLLYFDFGCDLCLFSGHAKLNANLSCHPQTSRVSTSCTVRNPDGLTANQLDNGKTFTNIGSAYVILEQVNLEDPNLPTVLGEWVCTCVNQDGVSRATILIEKCRKLVLFIVKLTYQIMAWM